MFHPMFAFLVRLLLALSLAGLAGCSKKLKPEELLPGISLGGTYYTQFSLFQEKDRFRTTNYRIGRLIPINSAARLVSINKKEFVVQLLQNNQTLTVANNPDHTGEDIQQSFQKTLKKTQVNLDQFSPEERQRILDGEVKKGMSRKAVLAAIGYPPKIATPSLEGSDWTYWATRMNRFVVRFKGDKVLEIVQ